MIEYEVGNKKKTVKASLQKSAGDARGAKNAHNYLVGDVVNFAVGASGRGDRMIATDLVFRYNNALDVLIHKASTENKFTGYLKEVDGKYFVKEIDSYLFFPLHFSAWQLPPSETDMNEPVSFSLRNLDKKEKIMAALYSNKYIPEFHTAVKAHKSNTTLQAEVYKVTEHGIYVNVIGEKIRAKIPLGKKEGNQALAESVKPGDKIDVLITHIGDQKIIVKPLV
jgi:hypothetical protein